MVRLDTNRHLTEAQALYRSIGYREIPAFNDEVFADHWFEKDLPRPAAQHWLKKPFSISRARSSEESSTLRGVSRKTLSAMRCMPPSRA